jgi:glycosyltransferase XagB
MAKTLFGEILIRMGYLTQDHLDIALKRQNEKCDLMGSTMLKLEMITEQQIDQILEFQKTDIGSGKLFGVCAVIMEIITEKQRKNAIKYQTTSRTVLGDILVELGYLSEKHRDAALKQQFIVI